jgi:hypothetical protein
MSGHDLQGRPVRHRKRDSIEGSPDHRVRRPGRRPLDRAAIRLVIRRFVKTARRHCTCVQAGNQAITAADPLPDDFRRAIETISRARRRRYSSGPGRVS